MSDNRVKPVNPEGMNTEDPRVTTKGIPQTINKEEHDDNYASKQIFGEQMLNTSLLVSNSAQIKALNNIEESERDKLWHVEMVMLIFSILLQVVTAILLLIVHFKRPLPNEDKHKGILSYYRRSLVTACLVLFISVLNYVISGMSIVTSD